MLFIKLLHVWRILVIIVMMDQIKEHGASLIKERIPDLLLQLCPDSNVCRRNTSLEENLGTRDSKQKSCCMECSCQPECGNVGRCCFDKYKEMPEEFATSGGTSQPVRECLSTVTTYTAEDISSFYMITADGVNNNGGKKEPCRTKKVAPWGSLYPVSSNETKKIYINEACAKDHNVSDGIVWNAYLSCVPVQVNGYLEKDGANYFAFMDRGEIPSFCNIQFVYPGDMKDVVPQKCYTDLVDKCPRTDFQVPSFISATKQEIVDACESGLVSPYNMNRFPRFANVFCYICAAGHIFPDMTCDLNRFVDNNKFVALIDAKMLKKSGEITSDVLTKDQLTVCTHGSEKGSPECRPIRCPSGQFRTTQGHCEFVSKTWYDQVYEVGLRLTSNSTIDIKSAFPLLGNDLFGTDTATLSPLISPWPENWVIQTIFYEEDTGTQSAVTKSFALFMAYDKPIFDPEAELETIQLLFNKTWYLQYQNESIPFVSELFKQKMPHVYGGETINDISFPSFRLLYFLTASVPANNLRLSKLYFCEQMELKTEEYVLYADDKVLFNKVGHKYLFDGEFSILYGFLDATARICVQDFKFKEIELTNCAFCQTMYSHSYVFLSLVYLFVIY